MKESWTADELIEAIKEQQSLRIEETKRILDGLEMSYEARKEFILGLKFCNSEEWRFLNEIGAITEDRAEKEADKINIKISNLIIEQEERE